MRSTISCDRGTVVLVSFAFTDQRQAKRWPALVLSVAAYRSGRSEVIVAAITSNTQRALLPGHSRLSDWQAAGLVKPSVATAILRTIQQNRFERALGSVSAADLSAIDAALAPMLDFRPR